METRKLWESALVEIELNVSKATFSTWFKGTHFIREEESVIYLGVPNQFVKDWLVNKYHKFILKVFRSKIETIRSVEYVITKEQSAKQTEVVEKQNNTPTLPLTDFYINKADNLNTRYTFDTFVVGAFNQLAYAASQAVIKAPGSNYNPLFIHGKTGHGKTHLIQAIGNYIKAVSPDQKVYYITSEQFILEYTNAVQNNKANVFKEKYRNYDMLIMDDIQFISKKEKTQEELFHLFNILYENNKQIIFSSDTHPNYIPDIEDRLKSRFAAGMIVDIPAPDHESRLAILRNKARNIGVELAPEIFDFLATTIEGNIRELEGALNTIACHQGLKGKDLSAVEIRNLIKDSVKPKRRAPIEDVIKAISGYYNVEEQSIYKKTRKKEFVRPRQIIMYILREDFNIPYPTIGQRLGNRDHTTVIHSYEKVKRDLQNDSNLAQEISQIRALL